MLNKIHTRLKVDLYCPSQFTVVNTQQGDENSRIIEVELLDNGTPYVIPEQVTISLQGARPDGFSILEACQHEGNIITCELSNYVLAVEGKCSVKIVLMDSDMVLSSVPFSILVGKNPFDENSVIATPQFSILTQAINAANEALEKATQINEAWAEQSANIDSQWTTQKESIQTEWEVKKDEIADAVNLADDAAENANVAASIANAETERMKALEESIENTESARVTSEQDRVNAETERAVDENERKANEINRQQAESKRESDFITAKTAAESAATNANNAAQNAENVVTQVDLKIQEVNTVIEYVNQSAQETNDIADLLEQETLKIFKEAVSTYADLALKYPNAENGWTVTVEGEMSSYRYNGTKWINLGVISSVDTATNTALGIIRGGGDLDVKSDGSVKVRHSENADTVGGKSVSDFVQNLKNTVPANTDILAYANTVETYDVVTIRMYNPTNVPTNYGYTNGTGDFWVTISVLDKGKYVQVIIRDVRSNQEFLNTNTDGTWQGWLRTNDGGNAARLGGLDNNKFVQWIAIVNLTMLQNTAMTLNYEGDIEPATAKAIGLSENWWHVKYQRHSNTAGGYGMQQFYPLNAPTQVPKYRTASSSTWDTLKNIGDGSNSDTLDGKHASDFATVSHIQTIDKGGTGATTKSGARSNLGVSVQSSSPSVYASGDLWIW